LSCKYGVFFSDISETILYPGGAWMKYGVMRSFITILVITIFRGNNCLCYEGMGCRWFRGHLADGTWWQE